MITDSQQPKLIAQNAVIVGGGPAGFATALMLAKRGWENITVLEKRASADYYEPDKSFSYQIDGRGQKLTDHLGITEALANASVHSTDFYITRIQPDSQRKTSKLPIVDSNRKTAYWLPRKTFLFLLYQEIQQNWLDKITILFNKSCVEINKIAIKDEKPERLEVVTQDGKGNIARFHPNLLVGCDGLNSIVRKTLDRWDESETGRFQMQYAPSPSSGLRYKVLTLLPSFPLDRNGEEKSVSHIAYAIRGKFRDRQRFFSLGVLPVKNPEEPRTANIITRPNHKIWELNNSEEVYNFLQESFPQLAIDKIVSPDEVDRFAASEGGCFPVPQYCSGFHFLLGENQLQAETSSQSDFSGVILLGDAIHCFPPDLGQGVNSALEDVYVLNQALTKSDDNLSQALPLFESCRFPDTKALVRLVQVGFPWQYNQDFVGKWLWMINFFMRISLNRLIPGLFSPPVFFMIQNHQLQYQDILAKADRSTRIIYLVGLLAIAGVYVWVSRVIF